MESLETEQMLNKKDHSGEVSPKSASSVKNSGGVTFGKSSANNDDPAPKAGNRFNRLATPNCKCRIKKEQVLLIITVLAVIIGVVLGLSLRSGLYDPEHPEARLMTRRQLAYLKFPGEMFLRMLQMLILPLIVSSIISSLSQLDTQTAGRLGMVTMVYYFTTTVLAVIEGIILVMIIQPGKWSKGWVPKDIAKESPCISTAPDTILDLIRNLFPENLVEACYASTKTCITYVNETKDEMNITHVHEIPLDIAIALNDSVKAQFKELLNTKTGRGINILGLIIFSMVFGVVISIMRDEGLPLRQFFKSLEAAMMRIISLVIWYAPVGIIFLTAYQIVEMDDPTKELYRLTGYMITVLSGLFIHGVIVLPLIMLVFSRRNPFKFAYNMLPALMTALGTSSSSATLPLTIKCCEEANGIDRRITRFMLPLGATINMDGTALYEAVAALYIAQTIGRVMSFGEIILISLTATLASIGAAGIPQAGIVTMIMVLIAAGLPSNYFILIIPVDWFLDRFRTFTNVHGDSLGTAIVQRFCQNFLRSQDSKANLLNEIPPDVIDEKKLSTGLYPNVRSPPPQFTIETAEMNQMSKL